MDIPLDFSKNIYLQIREWQEDYMAELIANEMPFYDALNKSIEEITNFLNLKWEDKNFRFKYADDITKVARNEPELFKDLLEQAKPIAKKSMDDAMDNYAQGKITKEEMEKTLKYHSVILEEIKE
jgi:hypothetical protein